jgi:DNA-binding beta-propeller fold protein YncE
MRVLILVSLALFFISSCKDGEQTTPITRSVNEVFIANEGNFGWGQGSLSIYNPESKMVQHDVFKTKSGFDLGNVFQSINGWDDHYYFVINNSNKIWVTDTGFRPTTTINDLLSPRFIYKVSESKAYVTDLYAKAISVVDLNAGEVKKTIPFNGWSEKGIVFNSEFWVTSPESKYVYCIDIEKDELRDSVEIGFASESIVQDDEMQLWVLSKGNKQMAIHPQLSVINPFTKQVTRSIPLADLPSNLVYSNLENTLYFLNNGVHKMQLSKDTVPQLWMEAAGRNLYALGVDVKTQELYVSDILDYVQRSTIYRYSANGELLDEFKAGIIAGNFFFKH